MTDAGIPVVAGQTFRPDNVANEYELGAAGELRLGRAREEDANPEVSAACREG